MFLNSVQAGVKIKRRVGVSADFFLSSFFFFTMKQHKDFMVIRRLIKGFTPIITYKYSLQVRFVLFRHKQINP